MELVQNFVQAIKQGLDSGKEGDEVGFYWSETGTPAIIQSFEGLLQMAFTSLKISNPYHVELLKYVSSSVASITAAFAKKVELISSADEQ
jgi:hypothetical protein